MPKKKPTKTSVDISIFSRPHQIPADWADVERCLNPCTLKTTPKTCDKPTDPCPSCGGPMQWLWWESPALTWQSHCGRAGHIQVCAACRHWTPLDFPCLMS